jgi:hypothetical protein
MQRFLIRSSNARLRQGLAVGLACAAATVVAPAPASAATANAGVYAVAPSSSWCPGWLNKVTRVQWSNFTTGGTGGDSGDDIVWMPVRTGITNSVNISVTCSRTYPRGMNFSIRPSRNGQTFWFYPSGYYGSN